MALVPRDAKETKKEGRGKLLNESTILDCAGESHLYPDCAIKRSKDESERKRREMFRALLRPLTDSIGTTRVDTRPRSDAYRRM